MSEQSDNRFKATIKNWTQEQLSNLHTCIPGKVINYDPSTNRASVQPFGKFKTHDERSLAYPIIHSVPCYFPVGNDGKSGLTFPGRSGDSGLIVFAEGQLTDFLIGEDKSDSADPRRHSLNDAIFLPGLYSKSIPANLNHPDDTCIFNELGVVQLNSNEFKGVVAGTDFRFGDGDLVVNGISLAHHVHGGVESGRSKTLQPE